MVWQGILRLNHFESGFQGQTARCGSASIPNTDIYIKPKRRRNILDTPTENDGDGPPGYKIEDINV